MDASRAAEPASLGRAYRPEVYADKRDPRISEMRPPSKLDDTKQTFGLTLERGMMLMLKLETHQKALRNKLIGLGPENADIKKPSISTPELVHMALGEQVHLLGQMFDHFDKLLTELDELA